MAHLSHISKAATKHQDKAAITQITTAMAYHKGHRLTGIMHRSMAEAISRRRYSSSRVMEDSKEDILRRTHRLLDYKV
jgi:hypothetical protein